MGEITELVNIAKKREQIWVKKDKETKTTKFDDKFGDLIFTKTKGSYCVPPSIKARMLTTLRSDLKSKLNSYEKSLAPEKKEIHLQSMVKRVGAYNRIVQNMRSCSSTNQSNAIEKEMELVLNVFSPDEILDKIKEFKDEETSLKSLTKKPKTRNETIRNEHRRLWGDMWSLAYNGMTEEKEQTPMSICGNEIDVGKGSDASQRTLDKMAFYGTRADWDEYYFNGDETVIHDNGTFEPLSDGDTPGCAMDFLSGRFVDVEDENLGAVPVPEFSESKSAISRPTVTELQTSF